MVLHYHHFLTSKMIDMLNTRPNVIHFPEKYHFPSDFASLIMLSSISMGFSSILTLPYTSSAGSSYLSICLPIHTVPVVLDSRQASASSGGHRNRRQRGRSLV
jgi:hypothetical protein